jgi:hypothetical protein
MQQQTVERGMEGVAAQFHSTSHDSTSYGSRRIASSAAPIFPSKPIGAFGNSDCTVSSNRPALGTTDAFGAAGACADAAAGVDAAAAIYEAQSFRK